MQPVCPDRLQTDPTAYDRCVRKLLAWCRWRRRGRRYATGQRRARSQRCRRRCDHGRHRSSPRPCPLHLRQLTRQRKWGRRGKILGRVLQIMTRRQGHAGDVGLATAQHGQGQPESQHADTRPPAVRLHASLSPAFARLGRTPRARGLSRPRKRHSTPEILPLFHRPIVWQKCTGFTP